MTSFQTRHYKAVAKALQEAGKQPGETPEHRDFVVGQFAAMFAMDNSKFKPDLFIEACRPGANINARTEGAK